MLPRAVKGPGLEMLPFTLYSRVAPRPGERGRIVAGKCRALHSEQRPKGPSFVSLTKCLLGTCGEPGLSWMVGVQQWTRGTGAAFMVHRVCVCVWGGHQTKYTQNTEGQRKWKRAPGLSGESPGLLCRGEVFTCGLKGAVWARGIPPDGGLTGAPALPGKQEGGLVLEPGDQRQGGDEVRGPARPFIFSVQLGFMREQQGVVEGLELASDRLGFVFSKDHVGCCKGQNVGEPG